MHLLTYVLHLSATLQLKLILLCLTVFSNRDKCKVSTAWYLQYITFDYMPQCNSAVTFWWHHCSSNEAGSVHSVQVTCRLECDHTEHWRCCLPHRTETWSHPTPDAYWAVCEFHGWRWSVQQVPTCTQRHAHSDKGLKIAKQLAHHKSSTSSGAYSCSVRHQQSEFDCSTRLHSNCHIWMIITQPGQLQPTEV